MTKEYINKIINADCADIMKQLPDKSIGLILTDPPYGINKKQRGGKSGRVQLNQIYDKGWDVIPTDEIFDEMFRISKNQIIWGGNYFRYLPPTRCFIVWDKKISENFSLAMCEMAWTSFDKNAKIFRHVSTKNKIHPTQKPLDLFMWCLKKYYNGGIVLDPYSGSGTTAIACKKLQIPFMCIEKDEEYWKTSIKRLNEYEE